MFGQIGSGQIGLGKARLGLAAMLGGTMLTHPAHAQQSDAAAIRAELDRAMAMIAQQQEQLDRQRGEIAEMRRRLDTAYASAAVATDAPAVSADRDGGSGVSPAADAPVPLVRVGQAPEDEDQPIEIAVLDNTSSVVTPRGRLIAEAQLDYTRADRSRAVFRGVRLAEVVLIGVFDINESRQDVLTGSIGMRYGVADRLEIGARLPLVYRSDSSIIAPVPGSTNNDGARTIENSVNGFGLGDLEVTARYQLIDGRNGAPYVIANLQGVFPTGSSPFAVSRDELGRAEEVATGAGFYSISPSLTAILPSDPVVLFGTLGYNVNVARSIDTVIPPVRVSRIDPGDAITASAGIGISFNQRTTVNLGYAHNWAFGTRTTTALLDPTPAWPDTRDIVSRDLQLGRLLFGVTYRISDRTSLNWAVEVGATEDSPDLRTILRVPFAF
ncbi:hypothetical protein A9D14_16430 (plasmid) [Croceicoccus marinus]|uniref:Transporter n=2 Tax=Croceicoccus marinus TaxID=450378 RepID=A0A1Z1FGR5_9SPHN|nr:hypothetical protein A9D14_16430 [Croceicoccus marinus]